MEHVLQNSYTDWIVKHPNAPQRLSQVSGFAYTVNSILNPKECEDMIRVAEATGFVKASLYTDPKGTEHYSDIRTSKRTMIDSRPFVDELWKRLAHAVPQTWKGHHLHIKAGATSPLNERLRILKYDTPGDEFKPHSDGQYASPDGGISELTILIYLNTDYTGAYTHFLTDDCSSFTPVMPTVGGVTIQDQRLVHAVPPLVSGVKYVVRTEVMYRCF